MAAQHEGASLASSLTDLMISLAVIFILLLVATLNNAHEQGQNTRTNVREKLKNDLEKLDLRDTSGARIQIPVEYDKSDLLAILVYAPEELLNFEFGKSDVPEKGRQFLNRIAPAMVNVICSEEFRDKIRATTVEGHADPIGTELANV